ncbi:hypothetical protein [Nocardioides coralli]|uniref:hypothetical protein n=1 Tax=Nocardioides coralli TaxID=2872154 RepID=UPI001CA3B229|nr:hypothetical protein [Nocardioides coralli]QZY29934.1 hypothetical protein K6T13_04405 [Nocardioides coralli]
MGAALLALPLAACSTSEAELHRELCAYFEADDFPELESLATQTLAGLDHSTRRRSTCEEWGQPRATLVAELPDPPSRADLIAHLAERGWLPDDAVGGGVYGSDRTYVASLTEEWEDGPVVVISFSRGT